jgi:hypothetical protein
VDRLARTSSHSSTPISQASPSRRVHDSSALSVQQRRSLLAARKRQSAGNWDMLGSSLYQEVKVKHRVRRDAEHLTLSRIALVSAMFACAGAACAIAQNELLMAGFMPGEKIIDAFKIANSACSMLSAFTVFALYSKHISFVRLQLHLETGEQDSDASFSADLRQVSEQPLFWLELLLCLIHLPPYCTFELSTKQMDNVIVYRAEGVFAVVNTLRVYLLARVFKHASLSRFKRLHQATPPSRNPLLPNDRREDDSVLREPFTMPSVSRKPPMTHLVACATQVASATSTELGYGFAIKRAFVGRKESHEPASGCGDHSSLHCIC